MTTETRPGASAPVPFGADALAERLVQAGLGMADLLSIHLGDQLGWYQALAQYGPLSAPAIAARTSTVERYAREWLEQQSVTGFLDVVDAGDDGVVRFALTPAARDVLTDPTSLRASAPLARLLAAAAVQLPALLRAYRHGGGVSWAEFGTDMRTAQADMNRPWFTQELPGALRSDPGLVALLERPGARAADIGCGAGWSTIAIARTFPTLALHGVDVDAPSVELARHNIADASLQEQIQLTCGNADALEASSYDVVFAFECVHDMPHPVDVLTAARRSLRPGGRVVVMDEAVAESFAPPGDDVERLMYGFSVLVCLPDAMTTPGSAATGTVMRPAVLGEYAHRAGFSAVQVARIPGFGLWRFYTLSVGTDPVGETRLPARQAWR